LGEGTVKKAQVEEPLLPPWVGRLVMRLAPLAVLVLVWFLGNSVLRIPSGILTIVLGVLGLGALIYFGGRLYKPFSVNKEKKCIARGAKEREGCRHYVPGARMGGGCGRLTENGKCRYVS